MKIGIALSGGGIRATVFHLGVLARLAVENRLEDVTYISTVSGGSLCVGLVYSVSQYRWPSSEHFLEVVVPHTRQLLTSTKPRTDYIWRLLASPRLVLNGRANVFSQVLKDAWGIDADLCEIPAHPRWIINATSHETGKDWRFISKRMGDYLLGYVLNPEFPLNDAIAASAGYPFLIGPLVLKTDRYDWVEYVEGSFTETRPKKQNIEAIHLWDGALYDNLGVEALFKANKLNMLRDEIDFLVVSDASCPLGWGKYNGLKSAKRVIDISGDQIRALRSRYIVDQFEQDKIAGRYFKLGNHATHILRKLPQSHDLCADSMAHTDVQTIAKMETTVRRLSLEEFEQLFQHGYEVADYTFHAYGTAEFHLMKFTTQTWK